LIYTFGQDKKSEIKGLEFKIQNLTSDIEDEKEKLHVMYKQRMGTLKEKVRDIIFE